MDWDKEAKAAVDSIPMPEIMKNMTTLYAEKLALANMAEILGLPAEAAEWRQAAQALQIYLQTQMYDPATGFFYDLQFDDLGNRRLLAPRGKGLAIRGEIRRA